jgi:hypothetical protein
MLSSLNYKLLICAGISLWSFLQKFQFLKLILKPEFGTQGPNYLDPICQVQPLAPKHQIKRHGEDKERRFITWLKTCSEKRQNKNSAPLQPSLGYRHKLQV